MPTVKDFEELRIWQDARLLSKNIYAIMTAEQFRNDYRFYSQIRAAAGPIMDNIAEGFERDGRKEFIQFLYIAKGSCGEVRSRLARTLDVGYIGGETYIQCKEKCLSESTSIANLISYLKNTSFNGIKAKQSGTKKLEI